MRKDIFSYLDQASTKKGFPHFFYDSINNQEHQQTSPVTIQH